MNALIAISSAMMRSWRNSLVTALGGNVWAMRFLAGVVLLAAGIWQWVMFSVAQEFGDIDLSNVVIGSTIVELVFLLAFQIALSISGILLLLTSGEIAGFTAVLAIAPVSRLFRRAIIEIPLVCVGAAAGLSASLPYVWKLGASWGFVNALPLIACWLMVAFAGGLAAVSLTRILTWAAMWVARVTESVAQPIVLALVIVVTTWQVYGAVLSTAPSSFDSVYSLAARLAAETSLLALLFPVVLLLVLGLLWCLGAVLHSRIAPTAWASLTGPRSGAMSRRPRRRWVLEFFQLVRHPSVLSLVVLNLTVLGVLVAHPTLRTDALPVIIPLLFIELPLVLSISSYGATWRSHWLYRVVSPRPYSWIPWKWVAVLAISLTNALVIMAVGAAAQGGSLPVGIGDFHQVLLWTLAGMLAGVIVPMENEQSLSSITTVIIGAGLGAGMTVLVDRTGSTVLAVGVFAALCVIVPLLYTVFVRWRERDLVHMH